MEEAILVARQVILVFMYIGIGVVCARAGVITKESGRSLSNFLVAVIAPAIMINSYLKPYDPAMMQGLALAFGLALLFHLLAAGGSILLIPKREDINYRIERLAAIFSNCGYMAIPLIYAALGDTGVFYAVAFLSMFNVMLWTIGVVVLNGSGSMQIKKAFFNPGVIGFLIGITIYFARIPVHALIVEAFGNITAINTPLAMITSGVFLSRISLRKTLSNWRLYYTAALRLLLFPLAMLVLVKLFHVSAWFPGANDVVLASMLGCACPAAASATLFPARFGLDSEYGAQLIAISTIFCLATIPLLTLITRL